MTITEEVVQFITGVLLLISVGFNITLMVLNARLREGVKDLRNRLSFYKGQTYELRKRRDELFEQVISLKTAQKKASEDEGES